jgi:hypothetical protein
MQSDDEQLNSRKKTGVRKKTNVIRKLDGGNSKPSKSRSNSCEAESSFKVKTL